MLHTSKFHFVWSLMGIALVAAPAAAQDLKYEKYKLDNGLTVILHEDHSLPVAAVNTWFRVGSKDEPPRRSGFAHLFEHLMFMGTQRVPGGDFDAIMEAGGGSNNAGTGSDTTVYFSSGPAALLPTLLWLDADRLEDLGRMTDQAKLDKQRDVVRNERRQGNENRPYGRAELEVQQMLFPPGHPYHLPVIGTHEDLQAATVPDVKDFFATYYVPNNASLCVAGDFDPAKIKPLIAELFGTLPRSTDPPHRTAEPLKLDGVKRMVMLDKVQLPMLSLAYHSPPQFAPGDAEMDLMASILSDGNTSRLYKRLIYEDKLAAEVTAQQESQQYGSMFRVIVLANPDADLDRVQAAIDEELAQLCSAGPTVEELERYKSTYELEKLSRVQGIEAKAMLLNEYEYFWGEPSSFRRDLDRYRQATVAGVQNWAKSVLTPDARVIIRVLPEEPERQPSPRDQRPADLASMEFAPPPPETFTLSNGIPVSLWRKPELPLVAVRLIVRPGGLLESPAQAGLTSLMAAMLGEGAGELDALTFGDAIQSFGATFDAWADHETLGASLTVLKRNFERAAGLLADAIRRPRFDPQEWERVQRLQLEELRNEDDDPETVAPRVAARLLFGTGHAYGWPVDGTPETVAELTVDAARQAHERLVRPTCTTVLVAGDLSVEEAKATLEKTLGDWKPAGEAVPLPPVAAPPPHENLSVAIVDRPEAVQTVICFVMPGPKYADPQRVQYRVLNTLLGGAFTSRLVQNIREAHGYTYGVHSYFAMGPSAGYFISASSVQAEVTGAAVGEFLNEFKRIRTGDVTPEEADKARQTMRTDVIQSFQGLGGVLSAVSGPTAAGLPFDTLVKDFQALPKISADELNRLAPTAIPLPQAVLVLVGDKASITEQLKKLDLPPPVEVTVRGEAVVETENP